MKRLTVVLFAALLSLPAYAGFDEVLAGLHAKLGRSTWIPGMGLVRAGIRVTHYNGVHDLQLAMFDGKGSFDPAEADRMMRTRIGGGYTPMVRVRSKRDHEWSFIYSKPDGELMDLVVLTNDGSDTVLVRVLVDPQAVTKYIDREPRNVALVARR